MVSDCQPTLSGNMSHDADACNDINVLVPAVMKTSCHLCAQVTHQIRSGVIDKQPVPFQPTLVIML